MAVVEPALLLTGAIRLEQKDLNDFPPAAGAWSRGIEGADRGHSRPAVVALAVCSPEKRWENAGGGGDRQCFGLLPKSTPGITDRERIRAPEKAAAQRTSTSTAINENLERWKAATEWAATSDRRTRQEAAAPAERSEKKPTPSGGDSANKNRKIGRRLQSLRRRSAPTKSGARDRAAQRPPLLAGVLGVESASRCRSGARYVQAEVLHGRADPEVCSACELVLAPASFTRLARPRGVLAEAERKRGSPGRPVKADDVALRTADACFQRETELSCRRLASA